MRGHNAVLSYMLLEVWMLIAVNLSPAIKWLKCWMHIWTLSHRTSERLSSHHGGILLSWITCLGLSVNISKRIQFEALNALSSWCKIYCQLSCPGGVTNDPMASLHTDMSLLWMRCIFWQSCAVLTVDLLCVQPYYDSIEDGRWQEGVCSPCTRSPWSQVFQWQVKLIDWLTYACIVHTMPIVSMLKALSKSNHQEVNVTEQTQEGMG